MSCLGSDKLIRIYNHLKNIPNNDIKNRVQIERPEQELIAKYLPSKCNVLEMGGESGTTSLIIDTILEEECKSKHIVVDPSDSSIPKMKKVKDIYSCKFKIMNGFIGKERKVHEELWSGCKNKTMYSLEDLEKMINDKFDVLVIDCEGAFNNILNEFPEILDSVKLIIIENDGRSIKEKLLNRNFTLIHTQCHPYCNYANGPWKEHFKTVDDLKLLKRSHNLIGFHEVYAII
jgi:hypothetical protein